MQRPEERPVEVCDQKEGEERRGCSPKEILCMRDSVVFAVGCSLWVGKNETKCHRKSGTETGAPHPAAVDTHTELSFIQVPFPRPQHQDVPLSSGVPLPSFCLPGLLVVKQPGDARPWPLCPLTGHLCPPSATGRIQAPVNAGGASSLFPRTHPGARAPGFPHQSAPHLRGLSEAGVVLM